MKKWGFLFSMLFLVSGAQAAFEISLANVKMKPSNVWLAQEAQIAQTLMLANISPVGTVRGVVIASPQIDNPNYLRHWVRDAALTMDVVHKLLQKSVQIKDTNKLEKMMREYVVFSAQNQRSAGLGEPIFEVNGHPFLGPWGRPQNDGPALRAVVLSQWAQELLDRGEENYVKQNLYEAVLPARSLIKADLEYVAWHWADPCFDLWEEVKASHFYTKMVQRKALMVGAQLARRLGDAAAADWYELQASYLEKSIFEHVGSSQGWISASLNWTEGLNSKHSNLDISVILGVLHGSYDDFFGPSDVDVQKTFARLVEVFGQIYPVNQNGKQMAPALGRYPEDIYAGANFNGGNPWVLATMAGAEYSYKLAREQASHNIKRAEKWMQIGDDFVQRVQYHANPDGSLSEQIDRYSGYMSSARDLTWSYASILTANWAREESRKSIAFYKSKLELSKKGK